MLTSADLTLRCTPPAAERVAAGLMIRELEECVAEQSSQKRKQKKHLMM